MTEEEELEPIETDELDEVEVLVTVNVFVVVF